MYKAIVFDLDGTLIDSPLCFKTIKEVLGIPQNEYILEYLDRLPLEVRTPKLKVLERIELEAAKHSVPFSGALEVLNRLKTAKILTGIFTRNCRSVTDLVIRTHGFPIERTITREDGPAKPDPTGIREFLKTWNLKGPELLFVGDFRFDIECGKNAGVKTLLFTNGKTFEETWSSDHIIPHYSKFWDHVRI